MLAQLAFKRKLPTHRPIMNRSLIYTIFALVILVAGIALYEFTKPVSFYGSVIQPPKPMPDFTLASAKGPVKLSAFRGKYVALYFGYTSCPDVCPTTLAGLKAAIAKLSGNQASRIQVIFVSVDYKSDTPPKVSDYAGAFSPDFIGLTGTQQQIDQVTQEFGIYYKLDDPDPATGLYAVEHTATILLLDPQGNLLMTWSYGQQPDEIASDLKQLLNR
jgi:protein SCO1/2